MEPVSRTVTAILVAAGASRRMGFDKLSYRLPDGRTVLETSVAAFDTHPRITRLVLVAGGNYDACSAIARTCAKSSSPSAAARPLRTLSARVAPPRTASWWPFMTRRAPL